MADESYRDGKNKSSEENYYYEGIVKPKVFE